MIFGGFPMIQGGCPVDFVLSISQHGFGPLLHPSLSSRSHVVNCPGRQTLHQGALAGPKKDLKVEGVTLPMVAKSWEIYPYGSKYLGNIRGVI
jgi:hypothetical protein